MDAHNLLRLDLIRIVATAILSCDESETKELARFIESLCRHRAVAVGVSDLHGGRQAILLRHSPEELKEWEGSYLAADGRYVV